jgi:oxygen-independent coproporphyrinogen-3 oxidase
MTTDTMGQCDDLDTLLKHDGAAPRYTSYPPANFFTQDPTAIAPDLLAQAGKPSGRPLSLYFHIPFCPRRCLFCGCHTEVDRPGAFIRAYMDTLLREFELLAEKLDEDRVVTQIHFGGGTPNAVPPASLGALLAAVSATFPFAPDIEIGMECDPGLVTRTHLEQFRKLGFNRISFGIQDVDLHVLAAVNRKPSHLPLPELVGVARELGFTGINLDLICGLPLQTLHGFRNTVKAIRDAGPDRISLFPYAHVPWIKSHQKTLETLPAPGPADRVRMMHESREFLVASGYESIGMDHFAKPNDELAIAKRNGTLRRNFQGYVTDRADQVHALGASAITQLEDGYLQNEKNLDVYAARVNAGDLPFVGGYRMRPEDKAAREVINALLCKGVVDVAMVLGRHEVESAWRENYWHESLERLTPFVMDGLVRVDGHAVSITPDGFPLSRRIAAAFDPRTSVAPGDTPRYSRAL